MGNKYGVLAGFFFFCLIPLFAQEASNVGHEVKRAENGRKKYFLKETDEGVTLIQRRSWESLDDILGFEFDLEQPARKTRI